MEKYIPLLRRTGLFDGISDNEIISLLRCLDARVRTYNRGEYVIHEGDVLSSMFILLSGTVHIQRDDYWGRHNIISKIAPGEVFGEAYTGDEVMLSDAVATEDASVMSLSKRGILFPCSSSCAFHGILIRNLYSLLASRNRNLVRKIGYLSKPTIREKVLSYLSDEAKRAGTGSFTIPFSREQLASYLSVDRSALSRELSKLKAEGIIDFRKDRFTIITTVQDE